MLPKYVGIIESQCKDPYKPIRVSWNVIRILNAAHITWMSEEVSKKWFGSMKLKPTYKWLVYWGEITHRS